MVFGGGGGAVGLFAYNLRVTRNSFLQVWLWLRWLLVYNGFCMAWLAGKVESSLLCADHLHMWERV